MQQTDTTDDKFAVVTTAEAAAMLRLSPQTLRKYACYGIGPIQPVRISNRLAWRIADINALRTGQSPSELTSTGHT